MLTFVGSMVEWFQANIIGDTWCNTVGDRRQDWGDIWLVVTRCGCMQEMFTRNSMTDEQILSWL